MTRDMQPRNVAGRAEASAFVHVALAAMWRVLGDRRELLLTKRPEGGHLAGYWELPGGKVQPSETSLDALKREIREELDMDVDNLSMTWLCICEHEYEDRIVRLETFLIPLRSGLEPGANHQLAYQWLPLDAIETARFPPANGPITREILRRLTPYPTGGDG